MLELIESLLDEPAAAPGEYGLVRVSRRAMATTFEVAIPQGSHPNAVAAAEDALELIDELEEQMTVFRDTSEVSQINAAASRQPVPVEVRLFELFQALCGLDAGNRRRVRHCRGRVDESVGVLSPRRAGAVAARAQHCNGRDRDETCNPGEPGA